MIFYHSASDTFSKEAKNCRSAHLSLLFSQSHWRTHVQKHDFMDSNCGKQIFKNSDIRYISTLSYAHSISKGGIVVNSPALHSFITLLYELVAKALDLSTHLYSLLVSPGQTFRKQFRFRAETDYTHWFPDTVKPFHSNLFIYPNILSAF